MKIFLAVFITALVAQASLAASIPDDPSDIYEVMKEVLPSIKDHVKNIINNIPDSDVYIPYKQSFEKVLKDIDVESPCAKKIVSIDAELTALYKDPQLSKDMFHSKPLSEDVETKVMKMFYQMQKPDFVAPIGTC